MPIKADTNESQAVAGAGTANGNPITSGSEELPLYSSYPLSLIPNTDHTPDIYVYQNSNVSSDIHSAMERHLHPDLLTASHETKAQYINNILNRYRTSIDPLPAWMYYEYRDKILPNYKPLHKELYTMKASDFFVPDFLKAVKDNTKESYRKIMAKPLSGVFVFDMFQKKFCQMLYSEVLHFENWAHDTKTKLIRPNLLTKFGVVLDDFGLETMLNKMLTDFISPIAEVLFIEVGGSTLDSHHGFVVEYGVGKDVDIGFHVDNAEVTLNVCLGESFSGGELYFRGVRCKKHIDSPPKREEILDYSHVPGRALLHHGRHRHGVKPTKSGRKFNLLLWCKSSVFRERYAHQSEFPDWCRECLSQKKERRRQRMLLLNWLSNGWGKMCPVLVI